MRTVGRLVLTVSTASALLISPSIDTAGAGATKRISLDATQDDPDGSSFGRSVSADGALIAYSSDATDLLADPGIDVNGARDVYVRDREGGVNILVSVGLDDLAGTGVSPAASSSGEPAISADGRYVAFSSDATNLVPGDINNKRDVFVRDLVAETTTRVSIGTGGQPSNGVSNVPAISADGRYVAFASAGRTLVNGDTNNVVDIFVRDTLLNTTKRVNLTAGGGQSLGGDANRPSISHDGTRIVFESFATNIVPGNTKGRSLIYLRDTTAATTVRVSTSLTNKVPDQSSYLAAISGDGTQVVFGSSASNLVAGDTNGLADIFAYDVATTTRSLVSVGAGGAPADGPSHGRALSYDGRYVAFSSDANNFDVDGGPQSPNSDVFEVDRATGDVIVITADASGAKANGDSFKPAMSADGSVIAYRSDATDLVFQSDDNGASDIYARTVSIVSVGETSVREGNDCDHTAKFVVTLSSPSLEPVVVTYATADDTAIAGVDYTATAGTLTFAPLEVHKAIQVPMTCETDDEVDETFLLNITDVDGLAALPGRVQGTGTLLDDDPSSGKFLQVGDTTIVEGDEGIRIARVGVVLSQPRAQVTTFTWTTVDGSATGGDDFTPSGTTVNMAPGDTGFTLMIPILPDQLQEGTETLTVVLSGANVPVTVSVGTVTILDDDPI